MSGNQFLVALVLLCVACVVLPPLHASAAYDRCVEMELPATLDEVRAVFGDEYELTWDGDAGQARFDPSPIYVHIYSSDIAATVSRQSAAVEDLVCAETQAPDWGAIRDFNWPELAISSRKVDLVVEGSDTLVCLGALPDQFDQLEDLCAVATESGHFFATSRHVRVNWE